jgi:predicted transcriptional regulator
VTGETQLRARRTRIKILRAIADKNGAAGFTDIRDMTGLSTGSIYYHLERMGNYVTKDSKHYMITEEGLQLLREVDPKYSRLPPAKKEEPASTGQPSTEETVRQTRYWGARQYAFAGALAATIIFTGTGLLTNWQMLSGVSVGFVSSIAVAAALGVSLFMITVKQSYLLGFKGTMMAVSALAMVLAGVLALQYSVAAPGQSYDNSMDALRSSYSLHWQIR